MEIEQGIAQSELMLIHLRQGDAVGNYTKTSLEHLQLEVGQSHLVLQGHHKYVSKYITGCWIKSVWRFLDDFGLQLFPQDLWEPNPQQVNDMYLMDMTWSWQPIRNYSKTHQDDIQFFCKLPYSVSSHHLMGWKPYQNTRKEITEWIRSQ